MMCKLTKVEPSERAAFPVFGAATLSGYIRPYERPYIRAYIEGCIYGSI